MPAPTRPHTFEALMAAEETLRQAKEKARTTGDLHDQDAVREAGVNLYLLLDTLTDEEFAEYGGYRSSAPEMSRP